MTRLINATVLALASSLLLAGCSFPPLTGAPSTTNAPHSTGPKIAGNGYNFLAPRGWTQPTDTNKPAGVDTFVANLADADGFTDNINVLLSPAGEVSPDVVESQGVQELRDAGATDVTVRNRVKVAGSETAHLSAGYTSGAVSDRLEQFYISRDGQTYVVTFSFSPTVSKADRDALTSAVLATWSWS